MKYIGIKSVTRGSGSVQWIHLERGCSKCGSALWGGEKYCPECGHKVLRLEEKVPEDFILEFLNGRNKTIAVRTEDKDDTTSVTAKEDPDIFVGDLTVGSGESHTTPKCTCPHGLDKATCGHCTPNGACDMLICTCLPPKYQMCPFHGDGFIFCKDA